ncbi:hypothetical protein MNBD_GAMMA20-1791 [hydrothermal vent metagenome]|uniref:Methanethiol S-methyltransferase n=1 Tax=hydrothermal vent metagenome TaxID=652676 RepID=A0A3B1AFM0_9ZZZZ
MFATTNNTLIPLAIGSVAYFILHSLLASLRVKGFVQQRFPTALPAYRLLFNLLSIILLLPLLWLVHHDPGPLLWAWQGPWRGLAIALSVLALGGFIWASRAYDMSVFIGLHQWRERHQTTENPEALHISSFHRFVRHPWYFLILLILWSWDQYLNQTVFYALATAYLIIGSRLEERKLVHQYGDVYRRYQRKVPGLIPLPWRWLRSNEAKELVRQAAEKKSNRHNEIYP